MAQYLYVTYLHYLFRAKAAVKYKPKVHPQDGDCHLANVIVK